MSATLVSPGYTSDRLRPIVHRILDGNMLCSMATTMEDGTPHIHNAFFCFDDDLNLYFLSHPTTNHARNIGRRSQMAVGVCHGGQPWGQSHSGLQFVGHCEPATGEIERTARHQYGVRFPLYLEFVNKSLTGAGLKPSFFELRYYVFRPSSVKVLAEADFGDEVLVTADVETA